MLIDDNALWLLLAAVLLDAVAGDPDWLWRRFPHPVAWIGKLITFLDIRLNAADLSSSRRKLHGVLTVVILVAAGFLAGAGIHSISEHIPFGNVLIIVFAAVLIAQNSLYRHVAAVRAGLETGGLAGGRNAVSMIVGRDPEKLDESGISRAAIESCAENFSDGVVAPAFWFALLGLPGLFAYKAVNTADSMIGHKNEKYMDFGWASARFDDLINLPASRLAGLFIAVSAPLAHGSTAASLGCIRQDAGKHRSPNAGWPEAAMAGALNIALAGPRAYPGYTVDDPHMNAAGRTDLSARDISRSLVMLVGAAGCQAVLLCLLAVLSTL